MANKYQSPKPRKGMTSASHFTMGNSPKSSLPHTQPHTTRPPMPVHGPHAHPTATRETRKVMAPQFSANGKPGSTKVTETNVHAKNNRNARKVSTAAAMKGAAKGK